MKNELVEFLRSNNVVKLEKTQGGNLGISYLYAEDDGMRLVYIDEISEDTLKIGFDEVKKKCKPSGMDDILWLLTMSEADFNHVKNEVLDFTESSSRQYMYDSDDSEVELFLKEFEGQSLRELPEIIYHVEVLRFFYSEEDKKFFIPIYE